MIHFFIVWRTDILVAISILLNSKRFVSFYTYLFKITSSITNNFNSVMFNNNFVVTRTIKEDLTDRIVTKMFPRQDFIKFLWGASVSTGLLRIKSQVV